MGSIGSRGVGVVGLTLACVLASASAPAAAADYYLKIEGVKGESKDGKHKGEIEIQSFSWGATVAAGGQADALTDGLMVIRYNSDPPPPAAGTAGASGTGPGAGKVSVQDISVMRGPRQSTPAGGMGSVADDGTAAAAGKFGAVSGVRRDDGLATVKRTHPALIKITKPLETGSMTMTMKLPGCTVGTRYPSAELTTPDGRYLLQDVVVARCGTNASASGGAGAAPVEQVTLNYAKVKVRGWNPEKKEL